MDAVVSPTLTVGPTTLMATQASGTVTVRFDDHFVPADRLTPHPPAGRMAGGDAFGSSLNGFLALGIAQRAARLLETDRWDEEFHHAVPRCHQRREGLGDLVPHDRSTDRHPGPRARTSQLAVRIASELTVRTGSRAALAGNHAQRLYREAGFLLVFGSRPAIQDELLGLLG
jgi:hypothetical protein